MAWNWDRDYNGGASGASYGTEAAAPKADAGMDDFLASARKLTDQFLEQSRSQAEKILSDADAKADRIVEDARQRAARERVGRVGAREPLLSSAGCWKTTSPPPQLQGAPV